MNEPPNIVPPPPAPASLQMIMALVGVAALSGLLIVVAFELTLPTITASKARALRRSVFEVLPEARRMTTFSLTADGALTPVASKDAKVVRFHAGYTARGKLAGVAIEAEGQGFQDMIKVIYGYSPSQARVIGMRVLESRETPGLGDKIGFDPAFLSNFKDLDVRLAPDGGGLLHPVQVVKKGARREKWQIDSITGATISSKAIGKLIGRSVSERLPQVHRNLRTLEAGVKRAKTGREGPSAERKP
ncbi:MAG: FMN-binding protein [bacterium]